MVRELTWLCLSKVEILADRRFLRLTTFPARATAVTWLAVLAAVLTVPALLRYTAVHTSANVNAHPRTVHTLANTSVNSSSQGLLSNSTLHDSTAVSRISGSPERLPPVSLHSRLAETLRCAQSKTHFLLSTA